MESDFNSNLKKKPTVVLGVYCAGPVSVEAIRNGNVNLPYDGRFVFAEVNSDKVHWVLQENGDWRKIIEKNV